MIIAVDGPAGSGKSTIAREVATCLGLRYLDTGAMYRTITLLALEQGLIPDRITEAGSLAATVTIRLEERADDLSRVFVDEREVTDEIRGALVTTHVSAVSADGGVRAALTDVQRREAARGDVVLEGRDVGTVVWPQADVKIFLTASVEERARRRHLQLAAKGGQQSAEELAADIERRDAYDSSRELAPLRKADDAIEIDTTGLTIAEVVAAICAQATAAGTPPSDPPQANPPTSPMTPPAPATTPPAKWPLTRLVRSPLDTLLWRVAYFLIAAIWRLLFRVKIEGREHVPLEGPVLLASNHRSNLDPFFLGVCAPRQIHFMAKAELWKVRPLGSIIDALGSFPVNRGEADRQAVRRALEVLDQGAVLGLFPEGRRQRDGGFGQINPGVSLFSLREGVVTIPVLLEGTDLIAKGRLPRPVRVRVAFGPALDLPPQDMSRAERSQTAGRRLTDAFHALSRGARTDRAGS